MQKRRPTPFTAIKPGLARSSTRCGYRPLLPSGLVAMVQPGSTIHCCRAPRGQSERLCAVPYSSRLRNFRNGDGKLRYWLRHERFADKLVVSVAAGRQHDAFVGLEITSYLVARRAMRAPNMTLLLSVNEVGDWWHRTRSGRCVFLKAVPTTGSMSAFYHGSLCAARVASSDP